MSSEPPPKRRRGKNSALVCVACRQRRIRCALPDATIQPSSKPQPTDKACERCQQKSLECVVEKTVLGRPSVASKVLHIRPNAPRNTALSDRQPHVSEQDFGDYLLAPPEEPAEISVDSPRVNRPSKNEKVDSLFVPFHLITALLSRDSLFASALYSNETCTDDILGVVDEATAEILDVCLVWHRLQCPGIPALPALYAELSRSDLSSDDHVAGSFLFALLCEIAIDVPDRRAEPYQHLHRICAVLSSELGQQVFFLLPRSALAVVGLLVAAEYRPLLLACDRAAALQAVKSGPYYVVARHIAWEMEYNKSGKMLIEALQDPGVHQDTLHPLLDQCMSWLWIVLAQYNISWMKRINGVQQPLSPDALESLDALDQAIGSGRLPVDMVVVYARLSLWTRRTQALSVIHASWRDLGGLANVICDYERHCDELKAVCQRQISSVPGEMTLAVLTICDMDRHLYYNFIVGQAMFFAIMAATLDAKRHHKVALDQAVDLADSIIQQLQQHTEDDPNRPDHRKFLERFGKDRQANLEKILTNFVSSAESLVFNEVPYIPLGRQTIGFVLYTCKEIVEVNGTTLKGWGELDGRFATHVILFAECARRLEALSTRAGNDEAMSRGCLPTAIARLIRSLRGIMLSFKRSAELAQFAKASSVAEDTGTTAASSATAQSISQPDHTEDLSLNAKLTTDNGSFTDWDTWPHFDPNDFSDLFGEAFGVPVDEAAFYEG